MKNLILLHGALGAKTQLEPLSSLLTSHFNCHLLELKGHGKTKGSSPFEMTSFAEELNDFIHQHKMESPMIFGYSMGGYISLMHALKYPGKLEAIMTLGTKFKWNPEESEKEVKKLNPALIELKVPVFKDYLVQLHGENWKENMLKTAHLMTELGNGKALSPADFSGIKIPVHFGWAVKDEMVTKEETIAVQKSIEGASFYLLENSKHPINQVDLSLLAEEIIRFFDC